LRGTVIRPSRAAPA